MAAQAVFELDSDGKISLQAALERPKVLKRKTPCDRCGGIPPLHSNDCPIEMRMLLIRYGGRKHDEAVDDDMAEGAIRFVSHGFADPTAKSNLQWEMDHLPPLPPHLKTIEHVLLTDILLRAYKFSTSGGRIKLRDLNLVQRAARQEGGIAKMKKLLSADLSESAKALEKMLSGGGSFKDHLEKVRQFISKGFETRFRQLKIVKKDRDLLVYHLIHDTEEGFAKVEAKDPGCTGYMLRTLVEQLKALEIFPKELEDRYGADSGKKDDNDDDK